MHIGGGSSSACRVYYPGSLAGFRRCRCRFYKPPQCRPRGGGESHDGNETGEMGAGNRGGSATGGDPGAGGQPGGQVRGSQEQSGGEVRLLPPECGGQGGQDRGSG